MFDMHHDLLTILYFLNEKKNQSEKEKYLFYLNKVYNENNVKAALINLYFMSEKEMFEELGMLKCEYQSVPKILKKSIDYLNDFTEKISYKPKFYYSIEGLDYINDLSEIDELYKLGVRSVLPVWNNDNKFAGGVKGVNGLTKKGKNLIDKLIELNIIIDLSHANERSFVDIVSYLKERNYSNVIVSHSNCFSICSHIRNLKDYQIKLLNEINGKFGLVTYNPFIIKNYYECEQKLIEQYFIKHIKHLISLGVNSNNIFISTDDMTFSDDDFYKNTSLYKHDNIFKDLNDLLLKNFEISVSKNLLFNNANDVFKKNYITYKFFL